MGAIRHSSGFRGFRAGEGRSIRSDLACISAGWRVDGRFTFSEQGRQMKKYAQDRTPEQVGDPAQISTA
jgi:hypothetical protein